MTSVTVPLGSPPPPPPGSAGSGAGGATGGDVRPIIPRIRDGLYQRAEGARDLLYQHTKADLQARGLRCNVLRSPPLQQSPWVSVELWVPVDGDRLLTQRAHAILNMNLRAYFRFEVEYTLELHHSGRTWKLPPMRSFSPADMSEVIKFLIGERGLPKFKWLRLRHHPVQLWRPRNKPTALRRDWLKIFTWLFLLISLPVLLFSISWTAESSRKADYYRNSPYWAEATEPAEQELRRERLVSAETSEILGIVMISFSAIIFPTCLIVAIFLTKRRALIRTSGKPNAEPRFLVSVDAWQTVVFGLGADAGEVRRRFSERLKRPLSTNMRWASEHIWYWGLDGTIEREQIVLSLGRALVFVHVQQYDKDLYVGWDAYLNRGQWVERKIFRGIDKTTGRLAEVRCVQAGTQSLNEYDVTDANSLLEWTHAQMVQVAKGIMEERKVDQEIDFKIIRGERSDLTRREGTAVNGGPGGEPEKKGILNRARSLLHLKRTG